MFCRQRGMKTHSLMLMVQGNHDDVLPYALFTQHLRIFYSTRMRVRCTTHGSKIPLPECSKVREVQDKSPACASKPQSDGHKSAGRKESPFKASMNQEANGEEIISHCNPLAFVHEAPYCDTTCDAAYLCCYLKIYLRYLFKAIFRAQTRKCMEFRSHNL